MCEWKHAIAILKSDFPDEFTAIWCSRVDDQDFRTDNPARHKVSRTITDSYGASLSAESREKKLHQ